MSCQGAANSNLFMQKIAILIGGLLVMGLQQADAQQYIRENPIPNNTPQVTDINLTGGVRATYFQSVLASNIGGVAIFNMLHNDGKTRWGIGMRGTENGVNATGANFTIFGYNNDGSLRGDYVSILREDGKVGLLTLNPKAALHVGNIRANSPYAALIFGVPEDAGNQVVPYGGSPGGYNIDFHTWRDVVQDQIGARIRAERINNFVPNSALVQGMDLVFSTSSGGTQADLKERMRIKNNGQVAIGTDNPSDYKLAVGGVIGAQRLKVTMTGWSDFVFHPSYNLISLQALQQFIRDNGHLPGIPTEREVLANGVDVGEMNKLLLQKVEELTLYLLEVNKKVEQQQERIKQLESRQER